MHSKVSHPSPDRKSCIVSHDRVLFVIVRCYSFCCAYPLSGFVLDDIPSCILSHITFIAYSSYRRSCIVSNYHVLFAVLDCALLVSNIQLRS